MKEHPILFSGPMVRAILDGKKTQTRRIMKPQPIQRNGLWGFADHPRVIGFFGPLVFGNCVVSLAPKYDIGDRLWVREAWCHRTDETGFVYNAEGNLDSSCVRYRADGESVVSVDGDGFTRFNKDGSEASPWKPSIHMPRWASRITLEITGVAVERIQDISAHSITFEGVDPDWDLFEEATILKEGWEEPEEFIEECEEEGDWINFGQRLVHSSEHKEWLIDRAAFAKRLAFERLWTQFNGPTSWRDNPWVWCIAFRSL